MLAINRNNLLNQIEQERLLAENLAIKKAELEANKTAVQERLANIVKQAAGWTTLDPWAQDALDAVKNNKFVDLNKLDTEIQTWINSQGQ